MKLFSGSANKLLTEEIAKSLNLPLSLIDVHIFPDGERRIRIHDKVTDKKAIVVQSASTPVDTNYMELFFIVDALKRAKAKEIIAIVPYFGYQRQDHLFRNGEAVSLEVVVNLLEHVGVNKLVSIDMHSKKIPSLFHIPVAHLSAVSIFAEEIKRQKWDNPSTVIISPDKGGLGRVKKLSEFLNNLSFFAVEKKRDKASGRVSMKNINQKFLKDKKRAIIIDDMISSGGTLLSLSSILKEKGIKEIYVFATHAVFSEDAPIKLQRSNLKKIYTTDSVSIPKEKKFQKLEILSLANILAKELQKPTVTNNNEYEYI
ncbi:MAG TPA: ribose-phosphate pyrophosphokinase [Patescibacteria group bacterium]